MGFFVGPIDSNKLKAPEYSKNALTDAPCTILPNPSILTNLSDTRLQGRIT